MNGADKYAVLKDAIQFLKMIAPEIENKFPEVYGEIEQLQYLAQLQNFRNKYEARLNEEKQKNKKEKA